MKLILVVGILVIIFFGCDQQENDNKTEKASLKQALENKFLIGVAMDSLQIIGEDTISLNIIKKHFNSVVAENCMKSEKIQPEKGKFDFRLADKFVEFGVNNNMHIVGHTLIWHSQAAKWFFVDENGKDVSKDTLIARMKTHISTVVGRYRGKVNCWDVVNEAFEDDGSWRISKFYEIIGQDYVKRAFQFAHEADPEAELIYNDFSMAKKGRLESVVKMIKELQREGIKIDGVGMQGHYTMDYPNIEEYEKAIVTISELGVKVMVTELDLTAIPFPLEQVTADVAAKAEYKKQYDPYAEGLPDSAAQVIHNRLLGFFKLFIKHEKSIGRVTVWGVSDAQSWRNYWPIYGRTDFPLLFDRKFQPKPIVDSIIKEAKLNNLYN